MLHLIANNSASVLVMNVVWWTVLMKGWLAKYMWDIDVASIKPVLKKKCQKSSLSLILSMLWRKYSIANCIHTNLTPWPFLASYIISSKLIKKIPLNSGNVLVISNGGFIMTLTKISNHSIQLSLFCARSLGIITRKLTVMTLLTSGRWCSKHQMEKKNTSLT